MQSLKSNNDMLQRLLSEVERLETENKQLNIKLKKAEYSSEVGNLKTKQTKEKTKDDTTKLNKANKQLKQKIENLTRSLKQKELEVTQLVQRLNTKQNIDDKDRQQVIQNFKRFQGRKPNSTQDHKTMQLIQYYQLQIQKKDLKITHLQQQHSNNISINLSLKRQLIAKQKQNESFNSNMMETTKFIQGDLDKIKGEMDINKLSKDLERKNIMIEKLRGDMKELRGKYEDLTKEYYQVYNELEQNSKVGRREGKRGGEEDEEPMPSVLPKKHQQEGDEEEAAENRLQYEQILNKLMEIYGVERYEDIVCSAIAADMALQNLPKMETYLAAIKQFLEHNLKTRISFSDLEPHLKTLQITLNASTINKNILSTIFNELSLTQSSYLQSIKQLKQTNTEYLSDLKKIKFVKQLSSARQIQEFITFFNLNPDQPLNSQILQLYQQLKSLHKFINLSNKLLDKNYDIPQCMEYILQVLERYQSQQQTLNSVTLSSLASSARKKTKQ